MALVSGGYKSLGTTLKIKISSTFTLIGNVTKIEIDGQQVDERETTNLGSTSRTYRPTIPTFGTCKFAIQFDPNDAAVHALLRGRVLSPSATLDEFQLNYPDSDTTPANDDFKGFVKKFDLKGIDQKGDTIMGDLEVRITDLFTATAGTP